MYHILYINDRIQQMSEGTRKERLLEGCSTRPHGRRNTNLDTCSISSTLDKLWSERVDFWANIEVFFFFATARIAALKCNFTILFTGV